MSETQKDQVLDASELAAKKVEKKSSEEDNLNKWRIDLANADFDASKYISKVNPKAAEAWKVADKNIKNMLEGKEYIKNEETKSLPEKFKNIDWKEISMNKMKLMETDELLKIKQSDRINLITKWDEKLDANNLKEWKELEFNFTFDWEQNKNLFLQTSAWQLLPHDVWSVKSAWVDYTRHWLTWEFFNKEGERLIIDDGTKIIINEKRDATEVQKIGSKITKDYYEILKNQKIDEKTDKNKVEIIRESLMKWLKEEEIKHILEWKYENLNKIEPLSRKKEVFKNLQNLSTLWLLDGDNSWEKTSKESLKKFAEKYNIPPESLWVWSDWYPSYLGWNPPDMKNLNYPEGTPEQTKEMINMAMWELWTHENSWKADKYFDFNKKFENLNARDTPWCAAFVNRALDKNGLIWTQSLASKSFIQWAWKWHVWFNVWGQLLWWNQSNRVSLKPFNTDNVEWWVMPHKMNEINRTRPFTNIPDWAIVVFNRGKNTT